MSLYNCLTRNNLIYNIQSAYYYDHKEYGSEYKFKLELVYSSDDYWLNVLDKFKIRRGRLYLLDPELEITVDVDGPWWNLLQEIHDDLLEVRKKHEDIRNRLVIDLANKAVEDIVSNNDRPTLEGGTVMYGKPLTLIEYIKSVWKGLVK